MVNSLRKKAERLRMAGWTYRRIAVEVGKSEGSVRNWLSERYNVQGRLGNSRRAARKLGHAACSASVDEVLNAKVETCPCCGESGKRMAIDHCHSTGRFRGWLCTDCNAAIGYVHERVETLINIIRYLNVQLPDLERRLP